MIEYPKIETVFDRDEKTFEVMPDRLRCHEFGLIKYWKITEKIDGTNVRVGWNRDGRLEFGGRTDNAQMPTFLLKYLQDTFTPERLARAFPDLAAGIDAEVTLFGEGYGVKIQSGGNYRTEGVAFRLFDVKVGRWWMKEEAIQDIASKLLVKTVPPMGYKTLEETLDFVKSGEHLSLVAAEEAGKVHHAEGIVARTDPMLFDRAGNRLIWKLKAKDFHKDKRSPTRI